VFLLLLLLRQATSLSCFRCPSLLLLLLLLSMKCTMNKQIEPHSASSLPTSSSLHFQFNPREGKITQKTYTPLPLSSPLQSLFLLSLLLNAHTEHNTPAHTPHLLSFLFPSHFLGHPPAPIFQF